MTTTAPEFVSPSPEACEAFNLGAEFLPQEDEDTLPCIKVAGVYVFTYVDKETGAVRVSIHLEDTDPSLIRPNQTVPLVVTCGTSTLFEG